MEGSLDHSSYILCFVLFFLNMSVSQSSLLYYLYFITFSSPVYSFSFFFLYSKRVFETLFFFFPYYFFLRFCIALDKIIPFYFYNFFTCLLRASIFCYFFHIFYYSLPIFIHNIAYTSDKNFCLLFLCNILLSSVFLYL